MIIVTHGHFDHLCDAIELAKQCECEIVSIVEVCKYCENQSAKVHGIQIGGAFDLGLGGKTMYHAGDTGLFGDMSLIGIRSPIDIAFLPIGNNFTMGRKMLLRPSIC